MNASRWVVHVDLDAFFTSVEQVTRPTLRRRPVLVGGMGTRGVVAGASYEARKFGARSAMPMNEAKRLVGPTVVVVPPRLSVYRHFSEAVFAIVERFEPVWEQLSFDEAFAQPLCLSGSGMEEVHDFCTRLRSAVSAEMGLALSVGAGAGKQVAKIASGLAKPANQLVIELGTEKNFLAPLSVGKLWGVGPVLRKKLAEEGIELIGDLASISQDSARSLSERAGLSWTIGYSLWQLAQGIDQRKVSPRAPTKQISTEKTYESDIVSLRDVKRELRQLTERAHARLISAHKTTRRVTVKMKTEDGRTTTKSVTLGQNTEDRETLIATALSLAPDPSVKGPIRLLGVSLGSLSEEEQLALFFSKERLLSPDNSFSRQEGLSKSEKENASSLVPESPYFHTGQDVFHTEYGHGWVQGSGAGFLTVRFETATSGPGLARTMAATDSDLQRADPLDCVGELRLPTSQ